MKQKERLYDRAPEKQKNEILQKNRNEIVLAN